MRSLRIELLNPKALKLLKDLAELKLISIENSTEMEFSNTLKNLRSKSDFAPSLKEISKEVKSVRSKRYGK